MVEPRRRPGYDDSLSRIAKSSFQGSPHAIMEPWGFLVPERLSAMPHRMSSWYRGIPKSIPVLLALVVALSGGSQLPAVMVVGVEFIDAPTYNPVLSLPGVDNLLPFQFTDPSTNFSAHGALQGLSELQVRQAMTAAVQQIFRRAEIDQPGRMLAVDIRLGAVDAVVGTVHQVGRGLADFGLFGLAYPTGATFRPDLQPGSVYTNALSLTLADAVNRIPVLDPTLQFNQLEQVVQAVAGTVAHEIAHTLNVWNHDQGSPVNGIYPIMASGATMLPLSARLTERRFLDIPNTQFEFPGPPAGGSLIYSTPETLLRAAGTTFVSDFNFDGAVDGLDFGIWNAHKFQVGTGVKSGDANDDGVTDGLDFNLWNTQRFLEAGPRPNQFVPEPAVRLFPACLWALSWTRNRIRQYQGIGRRLRTFQGSAGNLEILEKSEGDYCNVVRGVITSRNRGKAL